MEIEWPSKKDEVPEIPRLKCYKIDIFFSYRDDDEFQKYSKNLDIVYIEAPNIFECSQIWNDYFPNQDFYAEHPNDRDSSFSGQIFQKEEFPDIQSATAFERYCDWKKGLGWIEKPRWKNFPVIILEDYLKKDDILYIKNKKWRDAHE